MRAKVILLLLMAWVSMAANAQIVSWNASSVGAPGPSPWAPTSSNANVTIGNLVRASGVSTSGATASGAWGGSAFTGGDAAANVAANKYVYFSVTANSGYAMSFSNVQMSNRRSGTGPAEGELQYSVGGGTYATAGTIAFTGTTSSGSASTTTLSSISALQNVPSGTTVTFRIVPYGGGSSGTWYINGNPSPNGLVVNGTVVPSCTPPTATISGSTSICSGNTTNITFNGTPNAQVIYNINGGSNQNVTLNGSGVATVTTASLTSTTTYNLVSANLGGCSQNLTGNAVITITAGPTATISGTTAVCSGDNTDISFTGTANATITYNIDGGADMTVVLDGTGNATVNTGAVTAEVVYNLVSADNGSCVSPLTGSATVSILAPTGAISGTASVCSGGNADITFTGTPNATITYTVNGGSNQTVVLNGSGTATVNTGAVTVPATYDLVSVDAGTCSATISGSAAITVLPLPEALISGTATICDGGNADITFTGTPNAVITYTVDGGANTTVTLDGAGSATVNTGALSANSVYSLVSAELGACSQTLTGTATVTVNPLPTAFIGGSASVCNGTATDITFTGTPNATVTYNIDGGANTTVTLDGSGNAVVSTGALANDVVYNLVSVELGTCSQVLTGSASVTVTTVTVSISGTTSICTGSSTNITFTGTPNATVTYTVDGGANQTVLLDGAGTATINTGVLTADVTYALVDVSLGLCNATATGTAVVTIGNPVATISGATTICDGANTDITFNGTPNATVTYNIDGGSNLTVLLNGVGSATVNTGALTANTTYNLLSIDAGLCSATLTGSAVVTVNPAPTAAIAGTTTICGGANADITFTGTPNAVVTYTVNGGANTTVTLDGSGSATVNTGSINATATYALVNVSLNSCVQPISGSAVVTVNPMPTVTISGTTTICSGDNADVTFNGTPNAVITYTINSGANTTVTLNGAGTVSVNTGNLTANAVYTLVDATLNTCSQSQTGSATVTVNPMPTATIAGTTTICGGSNANITFTGTANAVVTYTINGGPNTTVTLNGSGTATVNTGSIVATATYALVNVSLNSCVQPLTGSAVVTVNTMPVATISGTTTICSGSNANITFTGTPNAVVTYNVNGGGNTTVTLSGAGSATVNTGSITANAVYTLVSVALNSCSQAQSGSAVVTVNPMPTVTIAGTTTICSGNNANITFTGTPNAVVTYTVNSGANTTITLNGAGTATVNTGSLSANATYALVSVSLNTCSQTQSGSATVTVNPIPAVTISGTTTICSGSNANITFTGTPNAVVTYTVNGGSNTTVTLSGAGTASVNTGALSANAVYSLVSVSLNSCSQAQSGTAAVTVTPLPTATISGTATICSGTNASVTFTGTPNALVTYTINGGANNVVALNASGTATVNTGSLSANAIYALVSANLNLCVQPLTGSAVITVNPMPTASIAGTTTICSGSGTNITFVGTPNAVVTYNINGGANTTTTLSAGGLSTVSTGSLTANAVYTLVSVSLNSCTQSLTGSATVTVSTMPIASVSGTTTICSGTNTNISFNGTPNAVVTYTVNGGANTTVTLSGTGTATVNTGNLTANAVYALVSVSLNTCSQTQSGSATVTVNPLPTATIAGTTTICDGDNADITFTGTPNAVVTYTINGGPNTTLTLDGSGNGLVNTGVISANAVYALVNASLNSCSQTQSGSATVTVNPLPTASISGTATICSGGNADITFTGTPNAVVTYNIDGGANTTVTLDGAGTATVNTGAITANTTYAIVDAALNSCTQALSGSAVVTVNTLPVATISGATAICSGDNTDITFSGTPNATVTYTLNTVSQTVVLDGTGNATVNTGAITNNALYELVSVAEGICSQNVTGDATVTVNPLPTVAISGTTAVCSGTGTDITFTGTPGALVTYTIDGGAGQTVTLDGAGVAILNTGNLSSGVSYDLVSVDDGQCMASVSGNASVSVNIIPTATISGTASICSGTSTNISFAGTPNADVFYTINSGAQLSISLDGTGNAVLNTGVLTGNAIYSIVSVSLNSCAASLTGDATITVSPAPTVAVSGSATLAPGNTADITFTGTPNATVNYTLNGAPQTVVLDAAGSAVVNTGVLFVDLTYSLVDVTLGCTAPATGSAVITMTIGYGPIYTYTNATGGAFDFVATDATGYDLSLFNGATVSGTPCTFGHTTEGYSAATSYDPATNKAVTMKVTPNGIHRLVITGFTVGVRRSADGPQYVRLAYSLDGGSSWIDSGVDEMPNNGACDDVATLNWVIAPFQVHSPTDGIMFGVFGFGAAGVTGQLQILNLNVNGAVIDAPLPVTVKHFKGECNNGDLRFNWGVAYESNIDQYKIQYSADGRQFNVVAEVAVDNLTKGDKEYNYILYDGAEGLYRLASVDNGGVQLFSKVATVKCNDDKITIPTVVNTVGGSLNIRTGSEFTIGEQFDVQVFNMNGQQVANYKKVCVDGMQQQQISLPVGVYLVRLTQGAIVSTHKVVIE